MGNYSPTQVTRHMEGNCFNGQLITTLYCAINMNLFYVITWAFVKQLK